MGRFDPFGMVSENFDVIGRYRTDRSRRYAAVVTTAEVKGLGADLDGPVSSLKEIADKLIAGSPRGGLRRGSSREIRARSQPRRRELLPDPGIKDNFAEHREARRLVQGHRHITRVSHPRPWYPVEEAQT